ncbi:hypothetical protein [Kitasatospora sp. HPMI-4]|uniref:hypothetical protein n=1 Tax=Kitasatospora sp. HPMI-4 TaxID=3448443 RepID=UPI003F1DD1AB
MQRLLGVLQGHPGRPAADPATDIAEQPVLPAAELTLNVPARRRGGGVGGMLGED